TSTSRTCVGKSSPTPPARATYSRSPASATGSSSPGHGKYAPPTTMLCPSCRAENQDGKKFCTECGSPLARACSSCGAAIEGSEKFCGECGSALQAVARASAQGPVESSAPAAERRLVSVLFADLVGFTPLSESRDAE